MNDSLKESLSHTTTVDSPKKIRVLILFGGVSSEHEISLLSATSIINNIPRERFEVVCVGITRDGRWLQYEGSVDALVDSKWEQSPSLRPAILSPDRTHHGLLCTTATGVEIVPVDVVFPVLHGKNGEDGTIQGLLDLAGIPYVGCGTAASADCMDKETTHILLENAGISTAPWITLHRHIAIDFAQLGEQLQNKFGYPVFVKPANAGSSVGVSKVSCPEQLQAAVALGFAHDSKVLIEKSIKGKEIECAVMGNENPVAPTTGELEVKAEFYDYNAKYLDGTTITHIPARISQESAQRIRETAVKAYLTLGCRGLSRVDFFLGEDGTVTLLEINTLPGFTSISMYPKMMMESPMHYPEVISKLIDYALE